MEKYLSYIKVKVWFFFQIFENYNLKNGNTAKYCLLISCVHTCNFTVLLSLQISQNLVRNLPLADVPNHTCVVCVWIYFQSEQLLQSLSARKSASQKQSKSHFCKISHLLAASHTLLLLALWQHHTTQLGCQFACGLSRTLAQDEFRIFGDQLQGSFIKVRTPGFGMIRIKSCFFFISV